MDEQSTDEQQPATESAAGTTETEQPADELTEVSGSQGDENSGEQQPAGDEQDDEQQQDDDEQDNGAADLSKLRREAAAWRTKYRAAEAEVDTLRREVFTARVKATGRLADASDMEFDAELLDDKDALDTAIDELLSAKPHLKARSFGNVGQSERPATNTVSLGELLRNGS